MRILRCLPMPSSLGGTVIKIRVQRGMWDPETEWEGVRGGGLWIHIPCNTQLLGYCTVCNCFNPSDSIDLMLKNWTAQLDTSAIRVSLHFSLFFQFLLSLFFTLTPIQKFQKLSLTLSLPIEHALESLSLSCLKKNPLVMLQLPLHQRMNVNQ